MMLYKIILYYNTLSFADNNLFFSYINIMRTHFVYITTDDGAKVNTFRACSDMLKCENGDCPDCNATLCIK